MFVINEQVMADVLRRLRRPRFRRWILEVLGRNLNGMLQSKPIDFNWKITIGLWGPSWTIPVAYFPPQIDDEEHQAAYSGPQRQMQRSDQAGRVQSLHRSQCYHWQQLSPLQFPCYDVSVMRTDSMEIIYDVQHDVWTELATAFHHLLSCCNGKSFSRRRVSFFPSRQWSCLSSSDTDCSDWSVNVKQ